MSSAAEDVDMESKTQGRITIISGSDSNFQFESTRYKSFKLLQKTFSFDIKKAARRGLFISQNGSIDCRFCTFSCQEWSNGEDPLKAHENHTPACNLLRRFPVGNVPSSSPYNNCHFIEDAKHKMYSKEQDRLNTYKTWPLSARQTPSKMADAGFFHTGMRDKVKCFQCGGELQYWNNEDPWEEHAKRFGESCLYVLAVKGEEYIDYVKRRGRSRDQECFLEEEMEAISLNPDLRCKVCDDSERTVCCFPCGHLAFCYKCSAISKECPFCNVKIVNIVRIQY